MKNCTSCGNPIPDNYQFCPACGSKQEPASPNKKVPAFCPSCGAPVSAGKTRFCEKCGAPLSQAAPAPQPAPAPTPTPAPMPKRTPKVAPAAGTAANGTAVRKKKARLPLAIILPIVFVLVIAGILVAVFFPTLQRKAMGDAQFYFYKESKTLADLLVPEGFDLRDTDSFSSTSEITFSAPENEDGYSDFEEVLAPFSGTVQLDYEKGSQDILLDTNLLYEDETLFQVSVERHDGQYMIQSDLMDIALLLGDAAEKDDTLNDALLDIFQRLCNEYLNPTITHSEKMYLGEMQDAYTYEMTYEQFLNMFSFLANELQTNEAFRPYYQYLPYEENGFDSAEEMLEYIKEEMQSELESSDLNKDQVLFDYTTIFDSRGKILSRVLNVKDPYEGEANFLTATLESDITPTNAELNFALTSETDGIAFYADFTRVIVKDKMSFSLDVNWEDEGYNVELSGVNWGWQDIGGVPALLGSLDGSFKSEYDEIQLDFSLIAEEADGAYHVACTGNSVDLGEELPFAVDLNIALSPDVQPLDWSVPSNSTNDVITFADKLEDAFMDAEDEIFSAEYYDEPYYDSYYNDSYYDSYDENGYSYSYGSGYDPLAAGKSGSAYDYYNYY